MAAFEFKIHSKWQSFLNLEVPNPIWYPDIYVALFIVQGREFLPMVATVCQCCTTVARIYVMRCGKNGLTIFSLMQVT